MENVDSVQALILSDSQAQVADLRPVSRMGLSALRALFRSIFMTTLQTGSSCVHPRLTDKETQGQRNETSCPKVSKAHTCES